VFEKLFLIFTVSQNLVSPYDARVTLLFEVKLQIDDGV